jgi:hypothetical protein
VTTTSFVLSSDGSTWVQGQPVVTTETQTDTLTSEELTACQPGNSGDNGNQKITFCHVPPGNPGNAHTITTSINAAVQAGHFVLDQEGDIVTPGGHGGDYLGKCQAASTPPSNGGTETPTATPTNTPTLPSGGGTQTPPSGTETPVSTQPSGGHGGTQTPASTPPSGNNGGENNGQPPVVNPPSNGGNPSGGQQIAEVVQQPVNGNVSQPSNAAVSGGQQASAGPSTVSELPIAGSGDSFGNNSGNPLLPLISFGSALCALLGWYMRRYGLGLPRHM